MVGVIGATMNAQAGLTVISGSSWDAEGNLNKVMSTISKNTYAPDRVDDSQDQLWKTLASPGATLVIELAGNAGINSFGLYDPFTQTRQAPLFTGSAVSGASVATIVAPSTPFGFYLGVGNGTYYYSQESLNPNGSDHMVTLQTKSEVTLVPSLAGWGGTSTPLTWEPGQYVLGWEDLNLGDADYQDMIVKVSGVSPVPEPSTVIAGLFLGIPFAFSAARMVRKQQIA